MNLAITSRNVVLATGADAASLIQRHRTTLEDMGPLIQTKVSGSQHNAENTPRVSYSLNVAQTAFITTKLETERATRRTALMAEVFALFSTGRLAPVDTATLDALAAAQARETEPTA